MTDNELATPEQVAIQQLSPLQVQAVAMLTAGHTGKDTAAALGVDVMTVSRWRKQEAFAAALEHAKAEVYDSLVMYTHSRARALVDSGDEFVAVKAVDAVYKLDAARMRANPNINVVHTVIDKLARAVASTPDAVDAEFVELDNGLSALPDPMSQR